MNNSCINEELIEGYISDEEFERKYLLCIDNFCDYMKKFVIPDAIAFYLANENDRDCLDECPLINHINSAIDVFNTVVEAKELILTIEIILKIKYNLKIIKKSPFKTRKMFLKF